MLRDWGVMDGPAGQRPRVAAGFVAERGTSVAPVEQALDAPDEQRGIDDGGRQRNPPPAAPGGSRVEAPRPDFG
jgi:hypothetical protein